MLRRRSDDLTFRRESLGGEADGTGREFAMARPFALTIRVAFTQWTLSGLHIRFVMHHRDTTLVVSCVGVRRRRMDRQSSSILIAKKKSWLPETASRRR